MTTKMMTGLVPFGYLSLYQGVPPEGVENMPTVNISLSQADLLVKFAVTTLAVDTTGVLYFANTPAPVNATATGTATWFVLSDGTGTTAANVLIGKVGDLSTTAPLLMHNPNVVAGEPVYVAQLGILLTS